MFTITPNKKAFLFYRILINSFYALLFVILSYFILSLFLSAFTEIDGVIKNYNWIVIPVLFLIFIFVSGLMYILRSIEYKKRSYIFEDGKIIQKSGGLFYDNQNEIIVKNITHVKINASVFGK